jgi:hypothetical protein
MILRAPRPGHGGNYEPRRHCTPPRNRQHIAPEPPPPLNPPNYPGELIGLWESRPCWICTEEGKGGYGPCSHREPVIDMAEIEGFTARRIWQENRLRALAMRDWQQAI